MGVIKVRARVPRRVVDGFFAQDPFELRGASLPLRFRSLVGDSGLSLGEALRARLVDDLPDGALDGY